MRLLLAEDSSLFREALLALVERLGHEVVETAASAPELEDAYAALAARHAAPDLVVTDVRMPPRGRDDGLLAALAIRAEHPHQPVLVLSQVIADVYARELLSLPEGGVGYLLKDRVNRVDDFARSLDVVAAGGTVVDPEVVARLVSRPNDVLDGLTPREREVLGLMADGLSNGQIADRLVLSHAAVSKHVGAVFSKLGLGPEEDNRRVKAVLAYLQGAR